MKRAYIYLAVVATAFLLIVAYLYFSNQAIAVEKVTIGEKKISVEIAKTSQEKSTGLCCRDSLDADSGMLFIFDTPGDYKFYMKDTRIPLDMYWLDSEKKIVHIEENVLPETYPQTFGSPVPALYVLETNAGFSREHKIKVGDAAQFIVSQ